ncbi:MAG: hypothetical protein J6S67_18965 [Methanobrevibacter sp.]|nr:hypothetical protein [Methanobrevibacter sp.]
MARNRDREFWESAINNNATYIQYYNRLTELSIAMFEWQNLPDTIDERFLELALFSMGMAVFFKDEVLGYLALRTTISGGFNVYRIPIKRRAFADNGYNRELDIENSVIIYNNLIHTNSMLDVRLFAGKLADLDRTIQINARAQKTPVLIKCDENQRLTMLNLYKEYDGNAPVIFGDKALNANGLTVLKTDAPYNADKLYTLKTQLWNEALTYLGISNINSVKKERMITDEVTRNQGGVVASRYSRLESRRKACEQINKMFGLDIWCDYREDYRQLDELLQEDEDAFDSDTERGGRNE